MNAGRSEGSIEFGARFSDLKFTNSSTFGFAGAKAYYDKLKQRLATYGRDPEQQFIIPGLAVYTGETTGDAYTLYRRIQELTIADFNTAELGQALGADLSEQKADARVSHIEVLASLAEDKQVIVDEARALFDVADPTLREVQLTFRRRGYFKEVVGNPRQVADLMEEWVTERAADGFMIFPPFVPGSATTFVELVIPELQRRGLFRTEYTSSTLREHFGLPRPDSRYAKARQAAA